jgi:2-oxoglutarate dehydrogenase E2 component (dihydrolipoamide succinyltransferase)
VTVEVAAPASGTLREILKTEQEEIAPGEVLGRLELEGTITLDTVSVASPPPASRPTNSTPSADDTIFAKSTANLSPAVRRLISERGLDAAKIRGSGEGGRITVDDVLAHTPVVATEISIDDVRSETPANGRRPAEEKPSIGIPTHTIPHTAIRKRTANHMVQSLLETSPHVTTVFEADLTAVMAHRAHHRTQFDSRGAPLTFTAYFLSASVTAIRAVPEANARWTDTALEIYDVINIGVATALPEVGLVVPVLHNLENKSLFDIARVLNERVTAARAGKLQPADVRGGTFTISNHGVSGSLLAAPIIINQPQSAILGIGKLEKRPVVIEKDGADQVIVRPRCYVTLTIDHRVMDGHQANRFLQVFVETLENWPRD